MPHLPTLLLCVVPALLFAAVPEHPLVPAQECHARAGLPHFFEKAKQGSSPLKVAYLGGSITAQAGWRVTSLAHLQQLYPKAKFSEINAAIGGTGSDLGVFRLATDVLVHRPDLLFVEFAVNDGGAAPEQIIRCMEGIVRQTQRSLPECDICFVYTLTEALAPAMLTGSYQRSASAMEQVAQHYQLPSIHLAMEVARMAKEGSLQWRGPQPSKPGSKPIVFSADSVHPYVETGHKLYLEAIFRSLGPIIQASTAPPPARLPSPLDPENYEGAKLVPIIQAQLSPGFTTLDPTVYPFAKTLAKRLPQLRGTTQPGETLRFRFKGSRCALYHVVGPHSGQVTVTVDGVSSVKTGFDSYCNSYRLQTLLLAQGLPDGPHQVQIQLHPESPDKAAILAKRSIKMDKPEHYTPSGLFPGALLLLGDLLP
jgi:lysophospholipase L1-like esterase